MLDKTIDVEEIKEIERQWHNEDYAGRPLDLLDVQAFESARLSPCYTTGTDRYSDNKMEFHNLIRAREGWEGKYVLDYACGLGEWSVYYALTGARKVSGFDISDTAVERGSDRVRRQGLANKVDLRVMDATELDYPDDTFDIVIGTTVLHHVIKYPGIFEELHRVMKPGAKAYFLEGLADFWLFKMWWKLKGNLPQGDVPIFANEIKEMTRMFSNTEVHGDNFVYALKLFLHKKNPGSVRRLLLKACKKTDDSLFALFPRLRDWGSFSYITLTK